MDGAENSVRAKTSPLLLISIAVRAQLSLFHFLVLHNLMLFMVWNIYLGRHNYRITSNNIKIGHYLPNDQISTNTTDDETEKEIAIYNYSFCVHKSLFAEYICVFWVI